MGKMFDNLQLSTEKNKSDKNSKNADVQGQFFIFFLVFSSVIKSLKIKKIRGTFTADLRN